MVATAQVKHITNDLIADAARLRYRDVRLEEHGSIQRRLQVMSTSSSQSDLPGAPHMFEILSPTSIGRPSWKPSSTAVTNCPSGRAKSEEDHR